MVGVGFRGTGDGGWDGWLVGGGVNGSNVSGWAKTGGGGGDKNVGGEDRINGGIEEKRSERKTCL